MVLTYVVLRYYQGTVKKKKGKYIFLRQDDSCIKYSIFLNMDMDDWYSKKSVKLYTGVQDGAGESQGLVSNK